MINFASKYSQLVDERFSHGMLTAEAVNGDYEWTGVKTLKVYSVPTAPMNDYVREGDQRYGDTADLGSSVQELTVKKDRSFTFVIDKGDYEETMQANSAGLALRRQLDEVVLPEIDKYRLGVMSFAAGDMGTGTISSGNAYELFLNGDMSLSGAAVPPMGRVAFMSPLFYKYIKLDSAFVKSGDASQELAVSGAFGMVDGVAVVRVPSGYLPAGVECVMLHPAAVTGAQKLFDYKIHDNPPGINGFLVEGRVCYDAFVLAQKACGVYVHRSALGGLEVQVNKSEGGFRVATSVQGLRYKLGGAAPALGEDVSAWEELAADGVLTGAQGGDTAYIVSAVGGKAASLKAVTLANE